MFIYTVTQMYVLDMFNCISYNVVEITKMKDQMQYKYQAQSNTGDIVTDFRMMRTLRYDLSYTKEPYKHIVS